MSKLIIRRATLDDMPVVGRLGALLVRTHYEFDKLRFMGPTRHTADGYAHFLGTQLEKPDVCVFVAELDGEIVGYTYAAIEPRDWMALRDSAGALYDILVDPAHREHGLGRKLLDATLEFLKERGAPRVVLSTAERNEPAQRLFEKAGFRRTMIEMTRELSS